MTIREITLAGLFAAITCVLTIVSIPLPFTPVPITLQVFGVVIAGAILGAKLGFLSQLTYLLIGLVGLPVYSNYGSGPAILFGPTGGFIFGFVVAAFIIGLIIDKTSFLKTNMLIKYIIILLSMFIGVFVIYTIGVAQLMFVLNVSLKSAIAMGAAPFIVADLIKVFVGSFIAFYARYALIKSNLIIIPANKY